jgi:hypothetical protein
MTRSFEITIPEVTLPRFELPWPDGGAIASSLKSRIPEKKPTSKLPMLLGAAIVIVVLIILAVGVKKMCGGTTRKEHVVETEPDGTSVVTDNEES